MSLEDDIRRMGEARADRVTTPPWRDHLGTARRRWPLLATAAAVAVVLAGLAIVFLPGDEDDDTDVAAPSSTEAPTTTAAASSTSSSTSSLSTTTTEATTVDPLQQTGICAANPVPSDEVLDLATHIAFDRTPLDLDGDGVGDEMLIYDDADGVWHLIARLQTGWTNALSLGDATLPALVPSPEGVPAAADLDGDGGLEFFLDRYDSRLGLAGLTSLRGCELVDTFPGAGTFGVRFLPPASDDCGSGCLVRVSCRDAALVQEIVFDHASPVDDDWGWLIVEARLVDGDLEIGEPDERTGSPLTTPLPSDAPGPDDTGVIDCAP